MDSKNRHVKISLCHRLDSKSEEQFPKDTVSQQLADTLWRISATSWFEITLNAEASELGVMAAGRDELSSG